MHFDKVLVFLNSVATPTSIYRRQALQLHADGVHTAKPEITMRFR